MSQVENPPPPPQPPPVGCGAVALMVIGAVILIPSGLCTAVMGVGAVVDLNNGVQQFESDLGDIWPFALLVAGAAVAGGFMLWAGIRTMRRG